MNTLQKLGNSIVDNRKVLTKRALIIGGTILGVIVANKVLSAATSSSETINVDGDLILELPTDIV